MAAMEKKGLVNVSVANLYRDASFQSEIVSQAVLNEPLSLTGKKGCFLRVKVRDNYTGWIDEDQVVQGECPVENLKTVRHHHIRLYNDPDENSVPVRDAVIGCRLSCVESVGGWYRIALPDNSRGWAKKEAFGRFPEFSGQAVVGLAREFLGYQYFWGGKTPKGLDCSGFVQLVFELLGRRLPRDSWMQEAMGHGRTETIEKVRPGNLLFFGKQKDRVTHVGISLGQSRFIHCQGMVKENSLKEGDPDFHGDLKEKFIYATITGSQK